MTLADAARDYMLAARALHTIHGSTDVHGYGGASGSAITEHCAWSCNATGIRYRSDEGRGLVRIEGPPPHAAVLDEYARAEEALTEALRLESFPNQD